MQVQVQVQVEGPQVVAKKKTKQEKLKSVKGKSIGELISSLMGLDIDLDEEGALDALMEKKLWKSSRKEVRDKVISGGGCFVGIQALRAHLESWLIQRKACQLLMRFPMNVMISRVLFWISTGWLRL
jgi:hypothetical protein